jgi:hypothetical protein
MPRKSSANGGSLSASLSVRIAPKIRYGLLLLSRKGHGTTSDVVQAMFRSVLAGRSDLLSLFVLEDLDELWNPVPWVRLQKLKAKRASLMTSGELNVSVRQSHLEPAVACDKDAVHVT